MRLIDPEELRRLLPVAQAIDALEAGLGSGLLPQAPPRMHVVTKAGDLLLMPAHGGRGVGVKLVTVAPENPRRSLPLVQGVYVLFDAETLGPLAVLDGASLTAVRTAAVSGLATRYLALPGARRLVVFGAGTQARAHVEAMMAVRRIETVRIVSRAPGPAAELAAALRRFGIDAETSEEAAVADADIVCTCTTSRDPVFDGSLLRPGTHVNAIGAYLPEAREVDDECVRRSRIVVETREAALAEAGDLLIPLQKGVITEEDILADLTELVSGVEVRQSADDITLFKSVGVAFEDLILAGAVYESIANSEGGG